PQRHCGLRQDGSSFRRAQGRGGSDSGPSDADGELSLGSGEEFEFGGEVVSEAGGAGTEGCFVGTTGCGEAAGFGVGDESGNDDAGCAVPGVSSGKSAGKAQGAYGEQGSALRVEQRSGDSARCGSQDGR